MVWLTVAFLALRLIPFHRLSLWLGPAGEPVACRSDIAINTAGDPTHTGWLVAIAVRRGARAVPWAGKCLPQAMAAKAMLARRRIRATLHLGAARTEGQQELCAHAWLQLGHVTITGAAGRTDYTEIARFG